MIKGHCWRSKEPLMAPQLQVADPWSRNTAAEKPWDFFPCPAWWQAACVPVIGDSRAKQTAAQFTIVQQCEKGNEWKTDGRVGHAFAHAEANVQKLVTYLKPVLCLFKCLIQKPHIIFPPVQNCELLYFVLACHVKSQHTQICGCSGSECKNAEGVLLPQ